MDTPLLRTFFSAPCVSVVERFHCIKMDLREIAWLGMDWVALTYDRDHGGLL
jgi:hypothetical protein